MYSKRDILMFLAGAMVFHTVSHIFLPVLGLLPMQVFSFVLTYQVNVVIIIMSALVSVGLLWWARNTK